MNVLIMQIVQINSTGKLEVFLVLGSICSIEIQWY